MHMWQSEQQLKNDADRYRGGQEYKLQRKLCKYKIKGTYFSYKKNATLHEIYMPLFNEQFMHFRAAHYTMNQYRHFGQPKE